MKNNKKKMLMLIPTVASLMMFSMPVFSDDKIGECEDMSDENPVCVSGKNQHGRDKTYSTAGFIDFDNAYFNNLVPMVAHAQLVMSLPKAG